MNAYAQAQRAYAPTAAPTRSDRSVEYDVIARITARLRSAMERDDYPALVAALHENRTLWRTFAIDVADAGNGLPVTLRARLFYLAEFTEAQTRKVLRDKASAAPLLEVNIAILRGLKAGETAP